MATPYPWMRPDDKKRQKDQQAENRRNARIQRSQTVERGRANRRGGGIPTPQAIDHTKIVEKNGQFIVENYFEGNRVSTRKPTATEVKRWKKATNYKPRSTTRTGSRTTPRSQTTTPTTSASSGSTPSTPSPQPIGAPSVTMSNTLDKTADKFFNDLYNPARREIERQRQQLDTQKAASQSAWDKFNQWNESKRAEAAGIMSTQQAENTAALAASRQQADENIKAMVQQARGSIGGSDFGAATGAEVTASNAADQAAVGAASAEGQSAIDKINAQRMADEQRVNAALASGTTADINAAYTKAAESLAQRNAALEAAISQSKLDRFYKDRQYGLDTAAMNWLMQKQGYQLGQTDRQIQAAEDTAAARGAAAGVEAAAERNKIVTESHQQALEWLPDVVSKYGKPTFNELPTHEQGQAMMDMAKALKASYGNTITAQEAQTIMAATFGPRFNNPELNGAKSGKSAIKDFQRIWGAA